MAKCKYCESEDLYLEAKNPEEDVLEADMVALKCKSCGKWLKWVRKTDRHKYLVEQKLTPILKEKAPIEVTESMVEFADKNNIDIEEFAHELHDVEVVGIDLNLETQKEQFAIKVLKELRKELLNEQVYYRSDVIGAIDRKIKKLNGER